MENHKKTQNLKILNSETEKKANCINILIKNDLQALRLKNQYSLNHCIFLPGSP